MIMNPTFSNLIILYLNTYGQTKLTLDKQLQIQDMVKHLRCDIVHLQETDFDENSFQNCNFIKNNYNFITNNSISKYGTASLIRNNFKSENISLNTEGRIIIFDIDGVTFCNVYLEAGTDGPSKAARENNCSETLPNLLVNRSQVGCAGGDWNCIVEKKDATNYPQAKMSPSLTRLVKSFQWSDSFRSLYPTREVFSHYYKSGEQTHATRIDREYNWGQVEVVKSEYVPAAFSDHLGLLMEVRVPINGHITSPIPRGQPHLKIRDEIAQDPKFQEMVALEMENWKEIRNNGLDVLTWWELVVKPGVKNIAISRSKEMNLEKRGVLNMLLIKQAYLVKKLLSSPCPSLLTDLHTVQFDIRAWYSLQSKKIQDQSRQEEFQCSENTRIYHHELHKKFVKRSSILRLDTEEGVLEGHDKCSTYLENKVRELLGVPAQLDPTAQETLLSLVSKVFTEEDNAMLETHPSKDEVASTLHLSNLKASAGSDGISGLVYKACWNSLGDSLTDVISSLFSGELPTLSMKTALMNFCSKPKKVDSIKPSDKRRISVLNCDFKTYEGLLARRFRKLGSRTLSPLQYVAGNNRTIQHGITRARDAITAATRNNLKCGIGDQDYIQAFDFLVLSWVWMVLERKGVSPPTLMRLRKLYEGGITIPVVNSVPGRAILDLRGSLKQGGVGSMEWFAVGIDPLLVYLDQNLKGIPISSLPVLGPVNEGEEGPLPELEERFKVMAFCDDVKPAICSIEEFTTADTGASLFEGAAGTRLHRDPTTDKCKFLALGRWRGVLKQDDIPTPYMRLTDTLDMVGVQLTATWSSTRKKNGDLLQSKVSNQIGTWRTGKFMPLTSRPFSVNSFSLSKVWFRCATVNLREGDFKSINSSIKRWLYADLLLKPEEMVLFRPTSQGGLGLTSVKHKAMAFLIRNFLDLANNPKYIPSQYLSTLYRVHVLDEELPCPPLPPYYRKPFFDLINAASNEGLNVSCMSSKQWYSFLLEREVTMIEDDNQLKQLRPCKTESLSPNTDWCSVWSTVRLPSLDSDATSFAWKLVHGLLPCEGRVGEVIPNTPSNCRHNCPGNPVGDLPHVFFTCKMTEEVGAWLSHCVLKFDPLASPSHILRLEVVGNEGLLWIIIQTLFYLWNKRTSLKKSNLQNCLSSLKAEVEILARTRHQLTALSALDIIENNCATQT